MVVVVTLEGTLLGAADDDDDDDDGTVEMAIGSPVGSFKGIIAGLMLGILEEVVVLAVLVEVGLTVGIMLEKLIGEVAGVPVDLIEGRAVGKVKGAITGLVVDDNTKGVALGRKEGAFDDVLPASTHCPHDEAGDATRVPVVEPYVPVSPVIVTSEPVTALTPPPDTQAVPPLVAFASVEIGIQLPCDPPYDVSNGRDLLGLPTPVYPELEVNRQPAVQYILANVTFGQSMGSA